MICPPCVAAGRLLTAAKQSDPENAWIPATLKLAGDYHKRCEHPDTCACHHHLDLYAWQ